MRLFEAILDANHRAVAGDSHATIAVDDFASELPLAALTCIDARLNRLLPGALGVPDQQFIWLRNAGNIITGPLSSTMRSLALGCAVKGAREIAVIGHTDCLVCKTGALQLLNRFAELGIERGRLPDNLTEYFGLFASERQNVIKAAEIIRNSPLIGAKVPVHGLLIDLSNGRLEWVVNGYEQFSNTAGQFSGALQKAGQALDAFEAIGEARTGNLEFHQTKVGSAVQAAQGCLHRAAEVVEAVEQMLAKTPAPPPPAPAREPETTPPAPPPLPRPNPIKLKMDFRRPRR